MRLLLAILLGFTITTSSTTSASAGPFQHPAILGDDATPLKPKLQPPDPKKLLEALPMSLAIKHCLTLQDSITGQYRLIDAFNTQPDLDNLPQQMSEAEREKTMLYIMSRADIADFGFLIFDLWKTTPRNLHIKWNALVTLRLDETLGFRSNAYPFADNCKGQMDGEITKDKSNFSHARITMPLAFDQTEAKLVYILIKQENYNWQIDDLLVNGVGVGNYLDKDLGRDVADEGLTNEIKSICQKSSFKGLKCD